MVWVLIWFWLMVGLNVGLERRNFDYLMVLVVIWLGLNWRSVVGFLVMIERFWFVLRLGFVNWLWVIWF